MQRESQPAAGIAFNEFAGKSQRFLNPPCCKHSSSAKVSGIVAHATHGLDIRFGPQKFPVAEEPPKVWWVDA